MAQPTGSTVTQATYGSSHTKRTDDTVAVVSQQFTGTATDGGVSYGSAAMAEEVTPFTIVDANRTMELFSLVSPAAGSQALSFSGSGTPRGTNIRTYDNTTGELVNPQITGQNDSTSVALTRSAPDANDLGQLFLFVSGPAVTFSSLVNCSLVPGAQRTEDFIGVAVFDVSGANPSFTLSNAQPWIVAAFDVQGTPTGSNFVARIRNFFARGFGRLT